MPYQHVSEVTAREIRRERVAALRLRGMTGREIADVLAKGTKTMPPLINPATGKPYERSTITRDITALRKQWQESAKQATSTRIARQLRELEELRRAAWAKGDLAMVARAMADERAILGWDGNLDLMALWRNELGDDVTEAELSELFNDYIRHLNEHAESGTA